MSREPILVLTIVLLVAAGALLQLSPHPTGMASAGTAALIAFIPGGGGYVLYFPNVMGKAYRVPLLDTDGGLHYGRGSSELHSRETGGFFIDKGDYLIVTSDSGASGITSVLRYASNDPTQRLAYFQDLAGGTYTAPYNEAGLGALRVHGTQYLLAIDLSSESLSVDLSNDGALGTGSAHIRLLGGGLLELGTPSSSSASVTLRTQRRFFNERGSDETSTFVFSPSYGRLDVTVASPRMLRDKDGLEKGLTTYGVFVVLDARRHPQRLFVAYPI